MADEIHTVGDGYLSLRSLALRKWSVNANSNAMPNHCKKIDFYETLWSPPKKRLAINGFLMTHRHFSICFLLFENIYKISKFSVIHPFIYFFIKVPILVNGFYFCYFLFDLRTNTSRVYERSVFSELGPGSAGVSLTLAPSRSGIYRTNPSAFLPLAHIRVRFSSRPGAAPFVGRP